MRNNETKPLPTGRSLSVSDPIANPGACCTTHYIILVLPANFPSRFVHPHTTEAATAMNPLNQPPSTNPLPPPMPPPHANNDM